MGNGGVVWNSNGHIFSSKNKYYNNKAYDGGALCVVNPALANDQGLISWDDVFYGNISEPGAKDANGNKGNGDGGAVSVVMDQNQKVVFKNGKFVNNISKQSKLGQSVGGGREGGGGAIRYQTSSGLLTGDIYVVDSIYNCTFYNNQCYDVSGKLSSTTAGADLCAAISDYSIVQAWNSKLQCTEDIYKKLSKNIRLSSDKTWNDKGGMTYDYASDPKVPATPEAIAGQGYTAPTDAEKGTNGKGQKIDCKDINEREEIDVTMPHADIITSKKAPKTFASYCSDDKENYWDMFQSQGGQGPFKFTFDVWKQKGHHIEKIVTGKTIETSHTKIKTPDTVITTIDENGKEVKKTIAGKEEYPDCIIVKGNVLFPSSAIEEGYLYTIIVKSMTDHAGQVFEYGCTKFEEQREFAQNTGAQIFFEPCTVSPGDLDWDDDGIVNSVECPDIAETNFTLTGNTLTPTNGKWVRYRDGIKTQKLFADIVNDKNYLNNKPAGGKVLTLLPSVLGATSETSSPFTADISDKFGYEKNSGAVTVTIHDFAIVNDRFMTMNGKDNNMTTWEIGGTMHPYVLMQSSPASMFNKDTQFGINILTNGDAYSQTELYTSFDNSLYTVVETDGTRKVIINNDKADLTNKVGLSYLNVEPGKKYFAFTQSAEQSGQVNTLVTLMLPCDDDMDGVPNYFDLDSDEDGCFDAIEGADEVTEAMLNKDKPGTIDGDVDTDGVPVAVNPTGQADKDGKQGQGPGSAYNDEENACGNNYWTGDADNDFNKKANWTNDVPKDGQSIRFADGSTDAKGKVAVRDLHLPAGKFISANKLVNNAPNAKFEEGATTKTAGHPAVVVPADGGLTVKSVEGFGEDGDKDKLVMKTSTDGKKVGTFILNNTNPCASTVYATVEFKPLGAYEQRRTATDDKDETSPDYNKTVWNEFDWQYIGLPVKQTTKQTRSKDLYIRAYSEKLNNPDHYYRKWTDVPKGSEMKAFVGYEVAPITDAGKGVHKIQGQLNLCEQTIDLTRQAAIVTASKATEENAKRYGLGYNIVGNSFMAGVDIKNIKLASGEAGVNMDNTVYIYTTGSWEDWKKENAQASITSGIAAKGGYEAVPINLAGQSGMTATIAPMQGFMVKYQAPVVFSTTPGKITIPYKGVVKEGGELRAKGFVMEPENPDGSILVKMDNGRVYDNFFMFQRHNTTMAYDNGYDGEKLNMGEPSAFGSTTDGRTVQVMTVPNVIGAAFSVQVSKGANYNMELTAEGLEYPNLKLVDMKKETVTPFVDNKVNYFFEGDVDGIEQNRFMFADTPETDFAKVIGTVTGIDNVSITLTKGEAELFNLSGAKIGTFSLPLNAKKLKGQVPSGVYLIKATDGTNVQTSKIVIE